jgi:hypothetical protein
MSHYKAPLRDVRFLLNEVFDYPAHYASLPSAEGRRPRHGGCHSGRLPPQFCAKTCWPR